jgi:hypothetical protein
MQVPVKLPIEVGKKYYLRNGQVAKIYSTEAGGDRPIHGATYNEEVGTWLMISFTEEGRATTVGEFEMDIVFEEWEPSDKELVWCWCSGEDFIRYVKFYDAKNNRTFECKTGKRGGSKWEFYAPFEGEIPEWAAKAVKKLKG